MSFILIVLLLLSDPLALLNIGWGSYGQQKRAESDNYRSSQSTSLTDESLPKFYITFDPKMPELASSRTSSTEQHLSRTDNDLSIYLLTYNVARQSPSEDLIGLFDFQHVGMHDIYVVALEELSFISMVTWDPYMIQLDNIFGQRGYVRLERVRYMITSLSVYVPRNKLSNFHDVVKDTVTTDLGMRKGGIGIRLYYDNISLAFVGAHLAAHEEYYQARLKNYQEIIEGLHFSYRPRDGLLDQDYSFFMGDLNFRINNLTPQQVYDSILLADNSQATDPNKWAQLLKYDQLRLAQHNKQAFHHFEEANITFPPTYRFIISTDNYDWQKRKPAFTDRILYRNTLSGRVHDRDTVTLRVVHYESVRQYRGSDHKPVRAIAHIPETVFEEKNKLLRAQQNRQFIKRDSNKSKMQKSPAVENTAGTMNFVPGQMVADSPGSAQQRRFNYYEDPSLSLARQLTVQFEPIRDWTLPHNHTIYFRVVDNRYKRTIGTDYPELFQVLSNWDWIGLYKEDFYSLDNYVTFAYPRFGNTVEEADDALGLLHDDTEIEDQLDQQSTSQASTPDPTITSSSSSAYLSSNEFGDGHSSREVVPGSSSVVFQAPVAAQLSLVKEEDEKSHSSHSSTSSSLSKSSMSSSKTSSSYMSFEETEGGVELPKEPSSVSSFSGSGDQTDSDVSRSSSTSCSSPTSAPTPSQSASLATSTTTTTTATTTTPTTSSELPDHGQEFSAIFDEQSFLFSTGRYVLIYRRKNGDVLGISEPFEIRGEPEEQPPSENSSN